MCYVDRAARGRCVLGLLLLPDFVGSSLARPLSLHLHHGMLCFSSQSTAMAAGRALLSFIQAAYVVSEGGAGAWRPAVGDACGTIENLVATLPAAPDVAAAVHPFVRARLAWALGTIGRVLFVTSAMAADRVSDSELQKRLEGS